MHGLRTIAYAAALVSGLSAADARAQQTASASAHSRAQVIAASFSKSKHVAKEKRGVRKEKYIEVRSTLAVKPNPADYSGTYEVPDMGFSLELRVDVNGNAQGTGYEPVDADAGVMRSFTLTNARIQGALLTGTQVYANGARERFEGVFINRTSFDTPNDIGTTEFGLGVMGKPVHFSGMTINRFFYQLKR